jgi:hypothetical protein
VILSSQSLTLFSSTLFWALVASSFPVVPSSTALTFPDAQSSSTEANPKSSHTGLNLKTQSSLLQSHTLKFSLV